MWSRTCARVCFGARARGAGFASAAGGALATGRYICVCMCAMLAQPRGCACAVFTEAVCGVLLLLLLLAVRGLRVLLVVVEWFHEFDFILTNAFQIRIDSILIVIFFSENTRLRGVYVKNSAFTVL